MRIAPILLLVVSGCGTLFGIDEVSELPDRDGGIAGHITEDTRWQGTVVIDDVTIIDFGVTVTALPGTKIAIANNAHLEVAGVLDVDGSASDPITFEPSGGPFYGGILVTGHMTLSYAVQHGGAVIAKPGGLVELIDTVMYGASGDLVISEGGSIDISFSELGAPEGIVDTTHCNLHTSGPVATLRVTHSLVHGSPFGMMFYGGTSADLTFDNWDNQLIDIDTVPGVAGDISGGYFRAGPPVPVDGATLIATTLAEAPLVDAGVRR